MLHAHNYIAVTAVFMSDVKTYMNTSTRALNVVMIKLDLIMSLTDCNAFTLLWLLNTLPLLSTPGVLYCPI